MKTYEIKLTGEEILALQKVFGGLCRKEISIIADKIVKTHEIIEKYGVSENIASMASSIIDRAKQQGRLIYRKTYVSRCPCCGRNDGYHTVKRETKYKRKGSPDYDNPKVFPAWEFCDSFITIRNSIYMGFCESCKDLGLSVLKEELKNIQVEVPSEVLGERCRWKKWLNMKCMKCDWTGHEGQMGLLPTLFDGGRYRGICPSCKAENRIFTTNIVTTEGFTMVEV